MRISNNLSLKIVTSSFENKGHEKEKIKYGMTGQGSKQRPVLFCEKNGRDLSTWDNEILQRPIL